MPPAPATSEMLAEMSACAYRLGMVFAGEAERTEDWARRLEMVQLFDRCFFAVRVATALQLRLRREGGEALGGPADTERPERDERERERVEGDRDRDRDTERASLPVLITTLQGVAADAVALPGVRPGELPTLQDILARATGEPAPARSHAPPLRDRLAGSAAAAVATASPAPRPSPASPARRATGPPLPPPRSGGRGTAG